MKRTFFFFLAALAVILAGFASAEVPAFSGSAVAVLGDPFFKIEIPGEDPVYLPLDEAGRVTGAAAVIGVSSEPREAVSSICPTGWQPDSYEFIPGRVLYNRCHLLAHQFGGAESAENLFTGTQFLNRVGMLSVENAVSEYINRTGNRVRYEVIPVFEGENQVCAGVYINAESVADAELRLSVFCYNVQPGVMIDYASGLSVLAATATEISDAGSRSAASKPAEPEVTYVLNTRTRRFHLPTCHSVEEMNQANRQNFYGTRKQLIDMGYRPCGSCNP